jgi:hypothetical protein
MANQPPFFTAQPPPDIPGGAGFSESEANYLRSFALWCRNGFATKLDVSMAAPGILLLSPGDKVFRITVSDTGVVTATAVALGSGKP